ncbi:MAG: hypothetical protein WEB60_02030, partial [Terrimicrobiaceae bacterium]
MTMKPRMFFTALAIGLLHTSPSHAQASNAQRLADQEIRRQEVMAQHAEKAIVKGNEALAQRDYESAFSYFKSAVDVLPSGGSAVTVTRQTALDGLSKAAVLLAEQRISEGRLQDATTTVNLILEDRYNPTYGPALALQKKLADPTRFNPALTP